METSLGLLLVALLTALHGRVSGEGLRYENVTEQIINGPSPEVIPIPKGSLSPLDVTIGFDFINIAKVDREKNEVEIVVWLKARWSCPFYAWNRSEFDSDRVNIPARYVWLPDLTVLNGVAEIESPNLVSIFSEGVVTWVTAQRIRVLCDIKDGRNDSGITCILKVLSWTYHGNMLSLNSELQTADTNNFFQGSKYELINTTVTKNSMMYTCCSEPYEDVTLAFSFKEKGVEAEDTDASSSALKLTFSTIVSVLAFCFVMSSRRNL